MFNRPSQLIITDEYLSRDWASSQPPHGERGRTMWDTMTVVVVGDDVPTELIRQIYETMKSTGGIDAPCGLLGWLNEEPQRWNLRCRVLADEIVKILGLRTQQLAMTHIAAYREIYQQSLRDVDAIIDMLTYVPSLNYLIPTDHWGGQ
ncbi:MAG: hypothetical protein KF893_02680 [Caldilineaceae bacterium]|nr:hypothetical protein [Caldilineaceae bacterium]